MERKGDHKKFPVILQGQSRVEISKPVEFLVSSPDRTTNLPSRFWARTLQKAEACEVEGVRLKGENEVLIPWEFLGLNGIQAIVEMLPCRKRRLPIIDISSISINPQ